MKLSEEIIKARPALEVMINLILSNSYNNTWQQCIKASKFSPQEPDFIADLTLNWTKDFSSILNVLIGSSFNVGIDSVFCHQKPLANMGKKGKKPEIGDLLIVLKYEELGSTTKYNALLLQAKSSAVPIFTVNTSDQHQLKLYEDWPSFTYERAGTLNGKKIDILPKRPNPGAKFLLLDPDYINYIGNNGHYPYGCAVANKKIVLSRDFANELIDFLMFNAGRCISDESNIDSDWSKMIWDLLNITKSSVSKRANSGLKEFNRRITINSPPTNFSYSVSGNTPTGFFLPHQAGLNDSDGNNINNTFEIDDDESGISTIFITVKQIES